MAEEFDIGGRIVLLDFILFIHCCHYSVVHVKYNGFYYQ